LSLIGGVNVFSEWITFDICAALASYRLYDCKLIWLYDNFLACFRFLNFLIDFSLWKLDVLLLGDFY
jgi:hypothetical protein